MLLVTLRIKKEELCNAAVLWLDKEEAGFQPSELEAKGKYYYSSSQLNGKHTKNHALSRMWEPLKCPRNLEFNYHGLIACYGHYKALLQEKEKQTKKKKQRS